ncbi:Hypothetical Protein FCC1311_030152 [Hondaea fermentalgiana]|uniref:Protease PrsW n=1 Tax=Hondaea fermentalgiana TaxID=2315210 RepID=A0A2R5GDR2_9STRA|nr:Hypothetical Protein FCC1311_030152 [Hondaea fermentalgiana]|eukprot:GBG26793.1 Hypothetical Protein FCC1311_030152 [Hondaea fermentalgiana]
MRRRDDDGALEGASELGWMFEASPDDLQVPVPEVPTAGRSQWRKDFARKLAQSTTLGNLRGDAWTVARKKKRKRQRVRGFRALVPGYDVENASFMSVAAWTSLVVITCMLAHEIVTKSLSNGIALFVLMIPPVTGLYTAAQRWEHKRVEASVVKELFLKGFGPGFLLLLFIEMFCAVTMLSYYCYKVDCSNNDGLRDISMLRDLRQLARILYQTSPMRGLLVAVVLCFFTAGLLEESTKLFFVSSAIRFMPPPQHARRPPPLRSPPPLASPPLPPGMAHRPASLMGTNSSVSAVVPDPDQQSHFGSPTTASSPTGLFGAAGNGATPMGANLSSFGYGADVGVTGSGLIPDAEMAAASTSNVEGGAAGVVDVALLEPEGKPDPGVTSGHGIVVYFLAFSAGLATSESMLYLICLANTPPDALRMALARVCFSLPMHAACGCFTGLGLIERYFKSGLSWFRVLLPAVILHGLYDFLLLLLRVTPLIDYLTEDQVEAVKYALSLIILIGTLSALRRRLRVYFFSSEH